MNEEAFSLLYNHAVSQGYRKSREEFLELLNSNKEAFDLSFQFAVDEGYQKNQEEFAKLLGVTIPQEVPVVDNTIQNPQLQPEIVEVAQDNTRVNLAPEMKLYPQIPGYQPPGLPDDFPTPEEFQQAQFRDAEERFLAEQKARERELEEKYTTEQANIEVVQSPDFQSALLNTNERIFDESIESGVSFLNNQFEDYNFIFKVDEGFFDDEITVMAENGNSLQFDTDELEAAKNFMKENATPKKEETEYTDEQYTALKVMNMRKGGLLDNGRVEAYGWETKQEGGKTIVYPTLFPKSPDSNYGTRRAYWLKLSGDEALEEAKKRNEVYSFDNPKEARDFVNGSWKDENTFELYSREYFDKNADGIDYKTYKQKFDEYEKIMNTLETFEELGIESGLDIEDAEDKLDEESIELLKDSNYFVDGKQVRVTKDIIEALEKKADELSVVVQDEDLVKVREDIDLNYQKYWRDKSIRAARENQKMIEAQDALQVASLNKYGVRVENLADLDLQIPEEINDARALQLSYEAAAADRRMAAQQFEIANMWYNNKFDKSVYREWEEGWSAVTNEWDKGWARGEAADIILQMGLGLENKDSKAMAIEISKALAESKRGGQARVLNRWQKARGGLFGRETLQVLKENPLDLGMQFMAYSLSQMLPYGFELLATNVGIGTTTGATIGATGGTVAVPGIGTGVGAIGGGIVGFKTGLATGGYMIGHAMEFTNAIIDTAEAYGYDMTNPDDVTKALVNEDVWGEGAALGHKRGIPIGIVNALSFGLAGNVIKVGRTASGASKAGAFLLERVTFDPAMEATGEFLAQVVAGQDLDGKEIFAEGYGGLFSNAPAAAVSGFFNTYNNRTSKLSKDLSTPKGMLEESYGASDTRIYDWTKRMVKLKKISPELGQKIERQLGNKQTAKGLLEGEKIKNRKTATLEIMRLLDEKSKLTNTPVRKKAFKTKIKEIDARIAGIADGSIKVEPTKKTAPTYLIGKESFETKDKFMEKINALTPEEINNTEIFIGNDNETALEVNEIFNVKRDSEVDGKPKEASTVTTETAENLEVGVTPLSFTQSNKTSNFTYEENITDETKTDDEQTTGVKKVTFDFTKESKKTKKKRKGKGASVPIEETRFKNFKDVIIKKENLEDFDIEVKEVKVVPKTTKAAAAGNTIFKLKIKKKSDAKGGFAPSVEQTIVITPEDLAEVSTTTEENINPEIENEINALEELFQKNNPQFSITSPKTRNQRITQLKEEAMAQMEAMENVQDEAFELTEPAPDVPIIPIEITENTKLANKVPRIPLDDIIGKKANFLMADQLKVDEKNKLYGGPFFGLTDKNFGKVAWASINKSAVAKIVNGAIDSDISIVFNMDKSSMDSNVVLTDITIDKIIENPRINNEEIIVDIKDRLKNVVASIIPKLKGSDYHIKARAEFLEDLDKVNTLEDLKKFFSEDVTNTEFRGKAIRQIVASREQSMNIPLKIKMDNAGLYIEDIRAEIRERFTDNLPKGAMTVVVEIQDKQGNKITEATRDQAIIDRKEQKELGLTPHPNYPFFIRGKVVGILEETVPVYTVAEPLVSKLADKVFDRTSFKQAKSDILRSLQTTANESFELIPPTQTKYQQLINLLSRAFPGVEVVSSREAFDAMLENAYAKGLVIKSQITDGGTVYGAVIDGKVFLNPKHQSMNAAIHEFGHIWLNTAKTARPDLYKKGLELVSDSQYIDDIKNDTSYQRIIKEMQKEGRSQEMIDNFIKEEALATAIGDKGEAFILASKEKGFKVWLKKLFNYIKSLMGLSKKTKKDITNMTMDEFVEGVVVDLLSGEPVFAGFEANNLENTFQMMAKKDAKKSTMADIIETARQLEISDAAIRLYLRKQGFKVAEINEAMKIDTDLFSSVPQMFGNIKGGMSVGMQVFGRVMTQVKKFAKKKNSTLSEVRAKAQEILKQQPEFQELNKTLQDDLLVALDKQLAIQKNLEIANDIKNMKERTRQQKLGARQLSDLQRQMKSFIFKNMPKTKWTSPQVKKFLNNIADAKFYKDFYTVKQPDDIRMVLDNVIQMINKQNTRDSFSVFDKLLGTKLKVKASARFKGKFLPNLQDAINKLKNNIITTNPTNEEDVTTINNKITELRKEFDKIKNKNVYSVDDEINLETLQIAILYNEARLMEDTNPHKSSTLDEASTLLKELFVQGRQDFKADMEQRRLRYNEQKRKLYKDVSGLDNDFNDKKETNDALRKLNNILKRIDNKTLTKYANKLAAAFKSFFAGNFGIDVLTEQISRESTDIYSTEANKLIYDPIYRARLERDKGVVYMQDLIRSKMEEYFGRNYELTLDDFSKVTINFEANPKRAAEIKQKLETLDKKSIEFQELTNELNDMTIQLTQNQMYYIYNQGLDTANHPGLQNNELLLDSQFDLNELLKQIDAKLDPRIRRWAEWQVQEFFPSVYARYNSVYKDVYRTNMPWNSKYAGRLQRTLDQEEVGILDLKDMNNKKYQTNIGGQSTIARINNASPIQFVDGNQQLRRYIQDMENFRAYAIPLRDVNKLLNEPLIKQAMNYKVGFDIHNMIYQNLQMVANPYGKRSTGPVDKMFDKFFDITSGLYIYKALAANPTIMLKQFSSSMAFADYIGYRNWFTYGTKELRNGIGTWNKTWQEMYKNSPTLQQRYTRRDFARMFEGYNQRPSKSFFDKLNVKVPKNINEKLSRKKIDLARVVDALMWFVKSGDKGGVMGSIPAYSYFKDQFKKNNPNSTDQQAIDFALDKVTKQIITTQQDFDALNRDAYQNNRYMRLFQLFTSSPRALLRRDIQNMVGLYTKMIKLDPNAGKGSLGQNLRGVFTYHLLLPLTFQFIASGFPGIAREWRDEDDFDFIRSALLGTFNSAFIVGDLLTYIFDSMSNKPWAKPIRNIPILDQLKAVNDDYTKYKNAGSEATAEKYQFRTMVKLAELFGVPANNFAKFYENYSKILFGDVKNPGEAFLRMFNYSEYQIYGYEELKRRANTKTSSSRRTKRKRKRYSKKETEEFDWLQ
tara:strand:- start:531 stop:9518 length:8988 start_codon:yes stop_codon:yes gene_type:complete